jgi:uncharacterized membrane protein YgcG
VGPEIPWKQPGKWLYDEASVLTSFDAMDLERRLSAVEKAEKVKIAVLTVKSLDGEQPDWFASRVLQQWQLGDRGVLILVAGDEVHITAGKGLKLGARELRSIADGKIHSAFFMNDRHGGLVKGVDAIAALVKKATPATPGAPPPPPPGRAGSAVPLAPLAPISSATLPAERTLAKPELFFPLVLLGALVVAFVVFWILAGNRRGTA